MGAVAATALLPQLTNLGASVGTSPMALGKLMGSSAIGIAQRVAFAYVLIGVIDLIYQRKRLAKVAEDDQAGGQGGVQAAERLPPRSRARFAAARCRPRAPA